MAKKEKLDTFLEGLEDEVVEATNPEEAERQRSNISAYDSSNETRKLIAGEPNTTEKDKLLKTLAEVTKNINSDLRNIEPHLLEKEQYLYLDSIAEELIIIAKNINSIHYEDELIQGKNLKSYKIQ